MVRNDTAVVAVAAEAVVAAEAAVSVAAAAVVVLRCWNHCFGSCGCDSLMGCRPRLSVLGDAHIAQQTRETFYQCSSSLTPSCSSLH